MQEQMPCNPRRSFKRAQEKEERAEMWAHYGSHRRTLGCRCSPLVEGEFAEEDVATYKHSQTINLIILSTLKWFNSF